MMMHVSVNSIALVFLVTYCVYCEDVPSITMPQGKMIGTYMRSYQGRTYSAFEGIPFAKPPIGELRFQEPQEPDKWEGVFYANTSYICMQYITLPIMRGITGTEDCLYLYVYVPKTKIKGDENLDVIVYIHGGAFMVGTPKLFSRPDYIMDKDVVFVTLNYRLGLLGFLSTQDDIVPGNNGLKDQAAALRWVKENIKYFGGNPNSVSLVGLSAGGASVHYHYLSPLSKGLFQRGYSQSGTALQHWALNKEPVHYMHMVANTLNCDTSSNQTIINCMKQTSDKILVGAIESLIIFGDIVPFIPFGPVIELGSAKPFLPDHPYKILKSGEIHDVPWVVSNCKDEGVIPAGLIFMLKKIDELYERWDELMPTILDITQTVSESDMPFVLTKIKEKYIHQSKVNTDNVYDWVELFTDRMHLSDAEKAVRLQTKVAKSPVYYYFFNYTLEQRFLIPFMKKGVAHSDDGRLMFPSFISPVHLKSRDEEMMKIFIEFLADFAADRELRMKGIQWIPVESDSNNIDFLHINGPEEIFMDSWSQLVDRVFWNSLPIQENDKLY